MMREPVDYTDGTKRFCGEFAFDATATAPRPGVLVVHEGGGINPHPKARAGMLAELGYVALACDMYGDGELTRDAKRRNELMNGLIEDPTRLRARVRLALDTLAAHPRVDERRLAAIGYCFGGMVALELARSGAELLAVVSFHGILATKLPAAPGAVRARILACTGVEDPLVPAAQVATFIEEMRRADADWQLVTYAHAGHGFTRKDAASIGIPGVFYDERADRRSWTAMRAFLGEVFEPPERSS